MLHPEKTGKAAIAEAEKEQAFAKLQQVIQEAIPKGFAFGELYKMPSWYISLEDYPAGYHCAAQQPLPFLSVALQKAHIAVYHMGVYANPELYAWFVEAYENQTGKKPDMGKSCIRFKKPDQIPFELMAELVSRMSPAEWISLYESSFRKSS